MDEHRVATASAESVLAHDVMANPARCVFPASKNCLQVRYGVTYWHGRRMTGYHTLTWPNGADFAPEFLRERVAVAASPAVPRRGATSSPRLNRNVWPAPLEIASTLKPIPQNRSEWLLEIADAYKDTRDTLPFMPLVGVDPTRRSSFTWRPTSW